MVECMSERPDIARGFAKGAKEDVVEFWESVAEQLNSLGPPTKDTSSWKKVWLDYRCYIKRKLSNNKAETRETGGGPNRMHHFNELEEKVIELTGLHTSTSGISGAVPFGVETAQAVSQPLVEPAAVIPLPTEPENINVQRRSTPEKIDTATLVQEQINLQRSYYQKSLAFLESQAESAKETSDNIRRMYQVQENMHDMKREKFREIKRHNIEMEALKRRELALQEKLLQIQERNQKK